MGGISSFSGVGGSITTCAGALGVVSLDTAGGRIAFLDQVVALAVSGLGPARFAVFARWVALGVDVGVLPWVQDVAFAFVGSIAMFTALSMLTLSMLTLSATFSVCF